MSIQDSLGILFNNNNIFWMCCECHTKNKEKPTTSSGTTYTMCDVCHISTKHVVCSYGS